VVNVSAIATAVPDYRFTLAETKDYLRRIMPISADRVAAIRSMFENACVRERYSPFPVEHFVHPRPLSQVSAEYRDCAVHLGRRVAADCLAQAGVNAGEVDLLVTVSCTGIMMPSLDAYLINELGFRSDVRRLPITELGCAGGAVALSRARDYILAYPQATALVVAVEFPTLTFQPDDTSMANLVSCALFGDGAAAALVHAHDAVGVRLLDSESHLFADSYAALGFELKDGGLHIVLGSHLAAIVRSEIRSLVERFLARHRLTLADISFWVIHPGGKKLIEQIEERLDLSRAQTQPTWDILGGYGNLSSAAVLFVMAEWLNRPRSHGHFGLMLAFGPGFSSEMLLLQWA